MRILHVITKGDVGGAQTHVVELVGAQIAAGSEVTVVAGTGGPALERCAEMGAGVSVVESLGHARARLWQREAWSDVMARIADVRPDVVHAHSSNAGFVARLACRRLGVPCVYTAHGWPFQPGAAWKQRVLSLAGEFVGGRIGDGVICLTEREAALGRRALVVRRGRVWVVPNGLRDVPSNLVSVHGAGRPRVVMVARFAPPKQQRQLIEAMAGLCDVDWSLSFVGDGPDQDACREAAAALPADRVEFLGHRDDVPELLARCAVLVLWSDYEGLPISVLEGMRAGLCCVGSDLPGVRVLVEEGAGLVAGSTAELTGVLRAVLTDPDRRAVLGAAGRARFVERFAIDVVERQVADVYAAVIARSSRGDRF